MKTPCFAAALFALGVLGLLARLWLALHSVGCDDADIWKEHADLISAHGVGYAYQHPELERLQFNHPPLMGYFSVFARRVARGDLVVFSRLMKAPGLAVDFVAAFLVRRIWGKRGLLRGAAAFAAYGASLPLALVSGFHCNTDCAYAGLTLLSVWLLHEKRCPLSSGFAMAGALTVKILPLLLIPPLLSQCRSRRELVRFACGASCAVLPFLPFLLTEPGAVFKTVIAYNSQQLEWGIYPFLAYAEEHPLVHEHLHDFLSRLTSCFVGGGRYAIVAAILALSALAFTRSRRFAYPVAACAWAAFLVFTPGYGVQYSVCVLPLLFAADLRSASLYGLLIGLTLLFVYTARMELVLPFHGYVQYYPFPKIAVLFGVLAWAVLVAYVSSVIGELLRARCEL